MSKSENKQYGEKKTVYYETTRGRKKIKTSRKFRKKYARSTMEKYVNANIKRAMGKLARAKSKGYYKASKELQDINSQLRTLYRKFGKDVNNLYKSKTFVKSLTSNADLGVLYRSVRDIMDLDMRKLSKEYKQMKEKLKERHIDLDSMFDKLSFLSSEFHDVFAFLSYNRVSKILESGDYVDVFEEFLAESQDKYLDLRDEQKLYRDRGFDKIKNAVSPQDWDYLKTKLKMRGINI